MSKLNKEEDPRTENPQISDLLRFPNERAQVALVQKTIEERYGGFLDDAVARWAIEQGLLQVGDVMMAEVSSSYRCPESCEGCPDAYWLLLLAIQKGLKTQVEPRAAQEEMKQRIDLLYRFGVRHYMFVGGTIDHLPDTPVLIEYALLLPDTRVSWFSDGIIQINESGERSNEYKGNINTLWFSQSATHVSMDYAFDGNPLGNNLLLPTKKGRVSKYKEHPDYSRFFKSQYGALFARRLIEDHVRRVVINITVSHNNIGEIQKVYQQASELQAYARRICSPTEVLFTFSPWIWRPHQARGDNPQDSSASNGLQLVHMDEINAIFTEILAAEYRRIEKNEPRLLANSSGYTEIMASAQYQAIAVNQDVPYVRGRPEILQIDPDARVRLDPMFCGPELQYVHSTFGYRDRELRKEKNPFSVFHNPQRGKWFPNIITT